MAFHHLFFHQPDPRNVTTLLSKINPHPPTLASQIIAHNDAKLVFGTSSHQAHLLLLGLLMVDLKSQKKPKKTNM